MKARWAQLSRALCGLRPCSLARGARVFCHDKLRYRLSSTGVDAGRLALRDRARGLKAVAHASSEERHENGNWHEEDRRHGHA